MRNALKNNGTLQIDIDYVKRKNLVSDEVKWSHIVQMYEFDRRNKLKIACHIKRRYLKIGHFNKMKVAPARAVLSKRTGKCLRWFHEHYPKEFGPEVLVTAEFCEQVGGWNDIINNSKIKMAFHASRPEKNAESVAFLNQFQDFYTKIKLHPKQKKTELKPTQKGVILTNASIKWLKEELLEKEGYKYFLTSKCSNDYIEGFHGDQRSIQKNPTAKQFLDGARLISVSDYMGDVENPNSDANVESPFMTSITELKEMHKKEEQEATKDLEIDMSFVKSYKLNLAEEASLSFLNGYFLSKIILKKQKPCQECCKAFITDLSDDQTVNSLINQLEFKEGALTRPSKLGNQIFRHAEKMFRGANLAFSKQKKITDVLTNQIVEDLKKNFPNIPQCHLNLIFRRFVNARLHFDAEHIDNEFIEKNAEIIKGKAMASKTAKGVSLE